MKTIDIREKLIEVQYPVETLTLGDFDQIGEFTSKKSRNQNDKLYKTAGAYFRPNYERGLLIYSLVKRFEIKTFFEIGFGRGYASICAAKAMCDMGWDDGKVFSVDPAVDDNHLKQIAQVFPREWFSKLYLIKGTVDDAIPHLNGNVDMVYIDGDHRYEAVKHDWEMVKDRYNKFVLFDDYDPKQNDAIQVKRLIDEIDLDKELIIMDRRIFFDDRRLSDSEIDYGQVLIKNPTFDTSSYLLEW